MVDGILSIVSDNNPSPVINLQPTPLITNIIGMPGPMGPAGSGSSLTGLVPYVNAKDTSFAGGAKGDGIIDDTAALQAFINYCVNNQRAGIIPAGVYLCGRLYGKYHSTNNPSGSTTPRNFSIFGEGRLGDDGRISVADPDRTVIKFTETTGTLFDFSTQGSPWPMRNIDFHDITLVGNTSGYVLDTSGAFKCQFARIGIWNDVFVGSGWKMNNFDQVAVDDVFIMGKRFNMSNGVGFDLRAQETAIDGSLSVFKKVLVQYIDTAFYCGEERDNGVDGHFQKFNTFISCAATDCNTAMILGDRWIGNTFISSQLRGDVYGIRLGSRADQNTFVGGVVQCNDETNAVSALYIGYGSIAANKQAQGNVFRNVSFQTNKQTAPPVIWNTDGTSSLVKHNVLEDCVFESINTSGLSASVGIQFTNSGNSHIPTGSIIRPRFNRVNAKYSYQGTMINIINPDDIRTLYGERETSTSTITTLRDFRPNTDKAISIQAQVVAFDQGAPTTNNHASYFIKAFAYNNNGSLSLVGTAKDEFVSNAALNCFVDVSGNLVRLRVQGIDGVNIKWTAKIDVIVMV